MLNTYATKVAQNDLIPKDVKVAFKLFLVKVEEAWLQPPTSDPNSPLGIAYYNFWKIFNEQAKVKEAPQKSSIS